MTRGIPQWPTRRTKAWYAKRGLRGRKRRDGRPQLSIGATRTLSTEAMAHELVRRGLAGRGVLMGSPPRSRPAEEPETAQ